MTLKDTISKWHRAICCLEQNKSQEAVQALKQIENPSAKIVYNLGCIAMNGASYSNAIEYFSSSIEKDKYLAIAYFQRGICYFKMKNYQPAEMDFANAKSMISNDGIDYRQLGADLILYASMVDSYHGNCRQYANASITSLSEIPFLDSIFRPPKKMVANLRKEDFLGKAKVISSVQEADIVYAEGKVEPDVLRRKTLPGFSPVPPKPASRTEQSSKFASSTNLLLPPPSRPPPRINRARSTGDLLDDREDETPFSGGASAAITDQADSFNKRQSYNDYGGYTRTSHEYSDRSLPYEKLSVTKPGLSVSSSAFNQLNSKPVVPEKPAPKTKKPIGGFSSHPLSSSPFQSPGPGNDFLKLQESLKSKLIPFEQNKEKHSMTPVLSQKAGFNQEKASILKLNNTDTNNSKQDIPHKVVLRKAVLDQAPSNSSQLGASRVNNNNNNSGTNGGKELNSAFQNQERETAHSATLSGGNKQPPLSPATAQKLSSGPPRPPKPMVPPSSRPLRPPPPKLGKR